MATPIRTGGYGWIKNFYEMYFIQQCYSRTNFLEEF